MIKWLLKKIIGWLLPAGWFKAAMCIVKTVKIINFFIMEKGLLTNKEERWLARFLDNLKKFKNPILEIGDYYFYRGLIKLCDDVLFEKYIPENWENPIRKLIELARANDVEAIGNLLVTEGNALIDLPFIDEPAERLIFQNAYGLLSAKIYEGLVWLNEKGQTVCEDDQD